MGGRRARPLIGRQLPKGKAKAARAHQHPPAPASTSQHAAAFRGPAAVALPYLPSLRPFHGLTPENVCCIDPPPHHHHHLRLDDVAISIIINTARWAASPSKHLRCGTGSASRASQQPDLCSCRAEKLSLQMGRLHRAVQSATTLTSASSGRSKTRGRKSLLVWETPGSFEL